MHPARTISLGLALTGLCALGLTAARPAAAQNFVYVLSGVTFSDGATAIGYFDFNPTTKIFGSYDITTTNGVTDALIGAHYVSATGRTYNVGSSAFLFDSSSIGAFNRLFLTQGSETFTPGIYPLQPATHISPGFLDGSGEFAPADTTGRLLTSGSLVVTAAPVPEASTTVSLGLLLTLGVGGLVVAKRKRADVKASSAL